MMSTRRSGRMLRSTLSVCSPLSSGMSKSSSTTSNSAGFERTASMADWPSPTICTEAPMDFIMPAAMMRTGSSSSITSTRPVNFQSPGGVTGGGLTTVMQEAEGRARARRGFDVERTAVAAHDAKRGSEPEPAAGKFRGEKRVENFHAHLGRHAAAVVAYLKENVVTGRQVGADGAGAQHRGAGAADAGGDGNFAAAFADGVGGVEHEVHHDLTDLRGVDAHGGQVGREREVQLCPGGDRYFDERNERLDQCAEVDRFDDEPALAGVSQHLPAEVG